MLRLRDSETQRLTYNLSRLRYSDTHEVQSAQYLPVDLPAGTWTLTEEKGKSKPLRDSETQRSKSDKLKIFETQRLTSRLRDSETQRLRDSEIRIRQT